MSRKDLIKSRININDNIKNDFAKCLGDYLNSKQAQSNAPFHQPVLNTQKYQEPNNFKKSLVDWRNLYSQIKFKKSNPKREGLFLGKENYTRPLNSSLSFAKSTFSNNNLKKQPARTPSLSCRKIHSSFQASHSKRKSQPFDPTLTPFVLVQNIYESSMNNLQETKRARTARIRHYYEKKAQKVQGFQLYDKLEMKINTCGEEFDSNRTEFEVIRAGFDANRTQFIRNGGGMNERRERLINKRKSKRIIVPNEYFKDLNKVRISRKNVFKQYQVEVQN